MKTAVRKVLAGLLVLSMVLAAVPWMPQSTAYAYDSSTPLKYYEVDNWDDLMCRFYIKTDTGSGYKFNWNKTSSPYEDAYIKLTDDISYEIGKVEHNNGSTWAVVLGDMFSAGLMEILWEDIDQKRPRYKDDYGDIVYTGGDVEYFLVAAADSTKVLDLNGHDLKLSYPNMNCHRATLFNVAGDLYITDSKGGGSIFLNGYITAVDDYDYFKNIAGGDQQRDIFYVHDGGRLIINGGKIECGRGKT